MVSTVTWPWPFLKYKRIQDCEGGEEEKQDTKERSKQTISVSRLKKHICGLSIS